MGSRHTVPPASCPDRVVDRGRAALARSVLQQQQAEHVAFGKGKALAYVVLDFDLTLSVLHVWNWLARSGKVLADRIPGDLSIDDIYGGSARRQELENFLSTLVEREMQVIVLTNNHRDVVMKCLKEAGFDKYVPDVIGRDIKESKGHIVSHLRSSCGTGTEKWVFVDDDIENVKNVEKINKGVTTVFVEGKGMKDTHLKAVLAATIPGFGK